jgi:hypothetical protein
LVTSDNRSVTSASSPFSFSEESFGVVQRVESLIGGFSYPGEVIVTDTWNPSFGEVLRGSAMFRIVLLTSSESPDSSEIDDHRICVASKAVVNGKANAIREQKSHYRVSDPYEGSGSSIADDLRAIREVREHYAVVADYGLNNLSSALTEYESEINNSMASESHMAWKSGHVVGGAKPLDSIASSGQIFLLDSPQSWIDVAAASLLKTSLGSPSAITLEVVLSDLKIGRFKTATDKLRRLSAIQLGEPPVTDRIEALSESDTGSISDADLSALLLHDLGFPPIISALWVVAFALDSNSEIEVTRNSGGSFYLSDDNVSDIELDELSFDQFKVVRRQKSTSWDTVLPFLKLIVPHASETRFGGGRETDEEEFNIQLNVVANRVRKSTPVMQSLEIAAGAIERPLTADDKRLVEVLGAATWVEYVQRARAIFGSVSKLRAALSSAALRWSTMESAPDIERAIYYLDQVDFGRVDHSLAVERQILRSRFKLETLVESPNQWLSLEDDFQRWRQEYRLSYLEDHDHKQEQNKSLRQRVELASGQVEKIELLEQIESIRLGTVDELRNLWNETIRSLSVCEYGGAEIRLIDEPECPNCHVRLGQPPNHVDIADMISEIDRLFIGYRDRLAKVVSSLVINSPESDKLVSLFRLNSAGDMSDLANVLDDKVISFLNDLFGKPGGTGGSNDDWAFPHY